MPTNQYELICSQIADETGLKLKEVKDGLLVLQDGSLLSLGDCVYPLLKRVKSLHEVCGELKVENKKLKSMIQKYRIDSFRKTILNDGDTPSDK